MLTMQTRHERWPTSDLIYCLYTGKVSHRPPGGARISDASEGVYLGTAGGCHRARRADLGFVSHIFQVEGWLQSETGRTDFIAGRYTLSTGAERLRPSGHLLSPTLWSLLLSQSLFTSTSW